MVTEINIADIMSTRLGAPQTCPKCKGENPSGLNLPEQCRWCGPHGIDKQKLDNDIIAGRNQNRNPFAEVQTND